jgi:hypothetical protein
MIVIARRAERAVAIQLTCFVAAPSAALWARSAMPPDCHREERSDVAIHLKFLKTRP